MRSLTLAFTFAFLTALFTVGGVLIGTKILGPLPLSITQTTTQKESAFTVSGESEVSVVPDNARVSLGIRVNKSTVAEAQNEVNRVMSELSTKITQLGIEKKDIRTSNYSVNPEYDYTGGSRISKGYTVSSTVTVDVKKFELVNQVIDTATATGVNEVGGVSFTLSDEKEEEVKKEAREKAIEKAKDNADELSRLAGMKLGKIINVTEGRNNAVPLYQSARLMEAKADAALNQATNIEAGTSSYNYSVTLSYETL